MYYQYDADTNDYSWSSGPPPHPNAISVYEKL